MLIDIFKIKPVHILVAMMASSSAHATNFGTYDVLDGTFLMNDPTGATAGSNILTSTGGQLIDHTYKTADSYQGNSTTPGSIIDNFIFFGLPVVTYTANTGIDAEFHPAVTIDAGNLTADMSSFYAFWGISEFNQGSKITPPTGDTNSTPVSMTDNGDGTYKLTWVSKIAGAPFDTFVGYWSMNIKCATGYICANSAPNAVNDTISTDFNTASTSYILTSNDSDPDTHTDSAIDLSTLRITGATGAGTGTQTLVLTNGTVVLTEATGSVIYMPNAGASGSETFTYTVQDELGQASENDFGATSNPATVTLTINAAGQPNAGADTATTAFATPVDIDVDINDVATAVGASMVPGSVAIASAATNGTAVANTPTTGTVRYTPNATFFGTDSFTYTIDDDVPTTSNAATVTVTVGSPPRADQPADKTFGAAPKVTIAQGTNTSTSTITKDGGNVTVSVDTSGAFYDQYSWTGTATEIVGDQSGATPTLGALAAHWTETSSSITFDPSVAGLTAGNYLLRVKMWDTDATPSAGVTIDTIVTVIAAGTLSDYSDTDNDGIVDSADDAALAATALQTETVGATTFVMETSSGALALGTSAKCAANTGAVITLANFMSYDANNDCVALTGTTDSTTTVVTGIGGYFDFEVRNLTAGETVSVAIPLSVSLPKNAGYRKYTDKWQAFETSSTEFISSASAVTAGNCPTPTSTDWTKGLTEGHNCILITITDGGANDADGKRNGIIVDPGTIVSYPGFNTDEVTLGGGWWFLMGLPGLLGLRRFTAKK